MLTLVSYPGLFGLTDNNPYGLKMYAFLKLCGVAFRHEHRADTAGAPRGQLPYLIDGVVTVGDSDAMIAYLTGKYALRIDEALTPRQRDTGLFVRRTLDDLYWVMSYSRWRDQLFYPSFRAAFIAACPDVTAEMLDGAREYNAQRYHYQGIGRYEPDAVYARGIADLGAVANLLPASGFAFGDTPGSADAGLYGFVANILFYEIETPLKAFLMTRQNLVDHCHAIHSLVSR